MFVRVHVVLGAIFSFLLWLIFRDIGIVGAGIIFLSSFLIDVDHYIYYIFIKKDFSLKNSVKHFKLSREKAMKMPLEKRKNYYSGWCFLHGFEILIVLVVLGYFVSEYFFFVFIGFVFHLFLDLVEEISNDGRIDKISCVYDFFKFRELERF